MHSVRCRPKRVAEPQNRSKSSNCCGGPVCRRDRFGGQSTFFAQAPKLARRPAPSRGRHSPRRQPVAASVIMIRLWIAENAFQKGGRPSCPHAPCGVRETLPPGRRAPRACCTRSPARKRELAITRTRCLISSRMLLCIPSPKKPSRGAA
jgi:hypothetical protein